MSILWDMLIKVLLSFLLLGLVLSPKAVMAQNIIYPQVRTVVPSVVKAGDMITLTGSGFGYTGQLPCFNVYNQRTKRYEPANFSFTYKTVLSLYTSDKSPWGRKPSYRLKIRSVTPTTIEARVPKKVKAGTYWLGYTADTPRGVCAGYNGQIVGFGKYDLIQVTQ